jgi:hypothetical protein
MSSDPPVDFDALPYAQRLQALLLAQRLPNVVNLGRWNMSHDKEYFKQYDFVKMTEEQLQQLARQLQARPSVTCLNLNGNDIEPDMMQVLAGPIAMQTGLHALDLGGTCLRCCFDEGVVLHSGGGMFGAFVWRHA